MTFNEFDKLTEDTFEIIRGLRDKKGKEYANSEDRLANFKRIAESKGISPLQVAGIFLDKHLDAINYYCKKGKVASDEPIKGRIHDAITYLLLMKGLLEEEETLRVVPVTANSRFSQDFTDYSLLKEGEVIFTEGIVYKCTTCRELFRTGATLHFPFYCPSCAKSAI